MPLLFYTHVNEKDNGGNYPLYVACRSFGREEIMHLIPLFPMAMKKPNLNGDYPLHLACYHHKSEDVFKTLIDLYPNAVRIKTFFLCTRYIWLAGTSNPKLL